MAYRVGAVAKMVDVGCNAEAEVPINQEHKSEKGAGVRGCPRIGIESSVVSLKLCEK